jgi:hypothetical protein
MRGGNFVADRCAAEHRLRITAISSHEIQGGVLLKEVKMN